jgi:hypothetical protein
MPKKEEEIATLLVEGKVAAELVRLGCSRGTVYKVNRRLVGEQTLAQQALCRAGVGSRDLDPSIDGSER